MLLKPPFRIVTDRWQPRFIHSSWINSVSACFNVRTFQEQRVLPAGMGWFASLLKERLKLYFTLFTKINSFQRVWLTLQNNHSFINFQWRTHYLNDWKPETISMWVYNDSFLSARLLSFEILSELLKRSGKKYVSIFCLYWASPTYWWN